MQTEWQMSTKVRTKYITFPIPYLRILRHKQWVKAVEIDCSILIKRLDNDNNNNNMFKSTRWQRKTIGRDMTEEQWHRPQQATCFKIGKKHWIANALGTTWCLFWVLSPLKVLVGVRVLQINLLSPKLQTTWEHNSSSKKQFCMGCWTGMVASCRNM